MPKRIDLSTVSPDRAAKLLRGREQKRRARRSESAEAKEARLAKVRAWRKANPEKMAANDKRWREANPERKAECNRAAKARKRETKRLEARKPMTGLMHTWLNQNTPDPSSAGRALAGRTQALWSVVAGEATHPCSTACAPAAGVSPCGS